MKVQINDIEYEYLDDIKDKDEIRNNFIEFIDSSFGFDFRKWYQEGYWSAKFEPHVLVKNNEVIATVTVNYMTYMYGEEKNYIQLGGVLTRKEYRKNGLGKWLMERIVAQYKNQCDAMFLLSNASAVNYYPQFGFKKALEHIAEYKLNRNEEVYKKYINKTFKAEKLDMENPKNIKLLLECYKQSNPFSAFPSIDCEELVVFYGMEFLRDCIYFFPELNMIAFAEYNQNVMILNDLYGRVNSNIGLPRMDIIKSIVWNILEIDDRKDEEICIQLGFSPTDDLMDLQVKDLDNKLYLLDGKENLFANHKLRLPVLSHN